ncbi:cupin domain-containing protein [Methylosoma difficile]
MDNIYQQIPPQLPEEVFESLFKNAHIEIERIISQGHASPDGFWYDQAWDEWVLVLEGQAILVMGEEPQTLTLNVGDYLLIPAHTRHRVQWTPPDCTTIWLAIHLRQQEVG